MTGEFKKVSPHPALLSIKDIAGHCCVSPRTVRRWILANELKIHRLGRQIRISETDFALFLKRHRE